MYYCQLIFINCISFDKRKRINILYICIYTSTLHACWVWTYYGVLLLSHPYFHFFFKINFKIFLFTKSNKSIVSISLELMIILLWLNLNCFTIMIRFNSFSVWYVSLMLCHCCRTQFVKKIDPFSYFTQELTQELSFYLFFFFFCKLFYNLLGKWVFHMLLQLSIYLNCYLKVMMDKFFIFDESDFQHWFQNVNVVYIRDGFLSHSFTDHRF